MDTNMKKQIISIGSGILCIILLTATMMPAAATTLGATKDTLTYSFTFDEPEMQTIMQNNAYYTSIHISGCIAIGNHVGNPTMPVQSVKILIPALKTVTDVTVIGDPVEVSSVDNPILPYQAPVPIRSTMQSQEFMINTSLYSSTSVYPSQIQSEYCIGFSHGYAILDVMVYPMQYIPSSGRLFYYPELTLTIHLDDTLESNLFYRNTVDDQAWVETLVDNPEITTTYANVRPFDYPGGLCDPSEHYDYVIITTSVNNLDDWVTSSTIPYNWTSLMEKHEVDDNLACTLVTIQDIDACVDYYNDTPRFNDLQAHIREFCKDAYMDWGTQYVLIGGDAEWIPARLMDSTAEAHVDADIYWDHLDNTFNADGDGSWGEEGDAGFDLYSELFIGRLTCDEPQDVSNWMTKSFYYADSADMDYIDNAAFYGGDTTWLCEGDDFIDYSAIKGTSDWLGPNPHADGPFPNWLGFQYGFETWNQVNPGNEFDLSVKWTAEPLNPGWQGGTEDAAITGLKDAINNDQVTIISGIAHANPYMSLDVQSGSWESEYHNTKPFFIHDYGCHCGDMDATDDGVLHSMLFHSDTELAFGCVYNTGYGWGNGATTNASSSLQQKLFWDYMFDVENNSGSTMNWQLGKAQAWSKDIMAPTINWDGTWREIIQACLLFADPAQCIKSLIVPPDTPSRPYGPSEGLKGVTYTFSTNTTDPEGDQLYYMWSWGDGMSTEWLGPYDSGETVYADHFWALEGDYTVKVRAKNTYGSSDWSEPKIIYVVNKPVLEIGSITGGLFKINAVIRNIGSADAVGVNWSISLSGGVILTGSQTTGRIISLFAGNELTISSDLIFGIGKSVITVTAGIPNSSAVKEADAMILLLFIKI